MALEISFDVLEGGAKRGKRYTLEADINGDQTLGDLLDFNQRATFSIAQDVLKEEQRNGFDEKPRVRTDNKFGKAPILVDPFGKIEYFAREQISEALAGMLEMIISRSPVDTGIYKENNVVFMNGVEIGRTPIQVRTYLSTKEIPANATFRIVNVTPYASRLEFKGITRGVRGQFRNKNQKRGRGKRPSRANKANLVLRPNGTFYLAERAIKRRYKAFASFVKLAMMPNGTDGIQIQETGRFRSSYSPDNKKRVGQPYVYPSILIKLSSEGTRPSGSLLQ